MRRKNVIRSAVRRVYAEDYLLTSLVAFASTVIVTRVFLQLTGFPQIGNDVLHIAHALWGGLLLMVAALLPLALANRWAIQTSALLGGVGTGLFVDEVGKFITQTNDYFYPPALSLIYGFILLNMFVYLYVRHPREHDPRSAMYHVLEQLRDVLDGDLDTAEAARIEAQLAIAKQSDQEEVSTLADAISGYFQREKFQLLAAKPSLWKRLQRWVDRLGQRFGRRVHRAVISLLLILWVVFVVGYVAVLGRGWAQLDTQVAQWRNLLITIQVAVGILMIVAGFYWLSKREDRGLRFAVGGVLLSLVALQSLYFYISQFSAISVTLLQLAFLQILFTYRRWYL